MTEILNVGVIFQGPALQAARFTTQLEALIQREGLTLIYIKKGRRTLTIYTADDDVEVA